MLWAQRGSAGQVHATEYMAGQYGMLRESASRSAGRDGRRHATVLGGVWSGHRPRFGARWGGSSGVSTARKRIASLGEEVSPVDLEGAQAWILASHIRELREFSPSRSCACCPASISMWSPRRAMPSACCPAIFGAACTGHKASSRRCCWSMAVWGAPGGMKSRAAASKLRLSRLSKLRSGSVVRPGTQRSVWPLSGRHVEPGVEGLTKGAIKLP